MTAIQLLQVTLGLKPYVLVEFHNGEEGDDDLRATIQAGGGPDSTDDIRSALMLALANLPDVTDMSDDELGAAIDAIPPGDGWWSTGGRETFHTLAQEMIGEGIPPARAVEILGRAYGAVAQEYGG
jgi:hypothetical protein